MAVSNSPLDVGFRRHSKFINVCIYRRSGTVSIFFVRKRKPGELGCMTLNRSIHEKWEGDFSSKPERFKVK